MGLRVSTDRAVEWLPPPLRRRVIVEMQERSRTAQSLSLCLALHSQLLLPIVIKLGVGLSTFLLRVQWGVILRRRGHRPSVRSHLDAKRSAIRHLVRLRPPQRGSAVEAAVERGAVTR